MNAQTPFNEVMKAYYKMFLINISLTALTTVLRCLEFLSVVIIHIL